MNRSFYIECLYEEGSAFTDDLSTYTNIRNKVAHPNDPVYVDEYQDLLYYELHSVID